MPLVYRCDNHPAREDDVYRVDLQIVSLPLVTPNTTDYKSAYLCPQCRAKLSTRLATIFDA